MRRSPITRPRNHIDIGTLKMPVMGGPLTAKVPSDFSVPPGSSSRQTWSTSLSLEGKRRETFSYFKSLLIKFVTVWSFSFICFMLMLTYAALIHWLMYFWSFIPSFIQQTFFGAKEVIGTIWGARVWTVSERHNQSAFLEPAVNRPSARSMKMLP